MSRPGAVPIRGIGFTVAKPASPVFSSMGGNARRFGPPMSITPLLLPPGP